MGSWRVFLVVAGVLIFPECVTPWGTADNISNTSRMSNDPAIAVDRNGHLHVVWEEFRTLPNEPADILYRHFDGDTWSTTMNVSNDSTESYWPRIAVDTSGYPHVIWEDWGHFTRSKIYYSRFDGDSFTTPFNLSDSLSGGYPLARVGGIAVDKMNNVHVIWSDGITGVFEVYHTRWDGNSWSDPVNVSNNPVGTSAMPELAIDSSNCLHVVWHDYGHSSASDSCDIYYSRFEGAAWTSPINVSNLPKQSWDQQIAVSREGNPHVVWREKSPVYYSYSAGDTWSTPYCLNNPVGEREGWMPDIVVDAAQNVHVVWSGEGPELWYSFFNGMYWSPPYDVSAALHNAGAAEIVVDKSQWLHLAWSEGADVYYDSHFPLCGDSNGDGAVTVADATYIVQYLYGAGQAPLDEGDVNLDGRITIADATYLVTYIYRGGPAPCE